MSNYSQILSNEFNTSDLIASNLIKLIEDGYTIPFIARYRKEMHSSMDDQIIRSFATRYEYLKNLELRRDAIKKSIEEKEKMTPKILKDLEIAKTLVELEDIYQPFKEKKKTRASIAIEAGLRPLADIYLNSKNSNDEDYLKVAEKYINKDNGFDTSEKCAQGARDIIAEDISNDTDLRKKARDLYFSSAVLISKLKKGKEEQNYSIYTDFKEKISKMPSHRILAINRGEKEGILSVKLEENFQEIIDLIIKKYINDDLSYKEQIYIAIEDSYKRLLSPSLQRESRAKMTDDANEQAIKMFKTNLKPLLMQAPLKGKIILGLDPAYRTGCKIAIIDQYSNLLDLAIIFPTPPKPKKEEAEKKLLELIKKYNVSIIAIGNGTATKESEIFVAEMIKKNNLDVKYAIVNEAGASVYSASKLGKEEFPNLDVAIRSAISIARRLQDPLAELVKIDVKSIGVGQYQHDMPQKRLTEVLEGVVEDAVNSVGVDLNTASESLLSYVSGITPSIAKKIVLKRKISEFKSRNDLINECKIKEKVFEQCAGFLRIPKSDNILDNTGVHPESYNIANALIKKYNYDNLDIKNGLKSLTSNVEKEGIENVAKELNVGIPTLQDIIKELEKPGRDIREDVDTVELRNDILDINSLELGMELEGVVRNVVDFGVFVDIGIHQDALLHLSQISKSFVVHASDLLKVADKLYVKIIDIDKEKNKVSLSLFTSKNPDGFKIEKKSFENKNTNTNKNFKNKENKKSKNNYKKDEYTNALNILINKYKK